MTTRNAAMAAAGWAAAGSAMTAAFLIWLLLARPLAVVDAVSSNDDMAGLARLAFATLQNLVLRILELL
jgi:hypothetical protein